MREFLEKNFTDESDDDTIKLAIRALLEVRTDGSYRKNTHHVLQLVPGVKVVESGSKNIEIGVQRRGETLSFLSEEEVSEMTRNSFLY